MEQLIKILWVMMFTPGPKGRWGLPVLLWGDPGIGKSAIVEQVAASVSLYCTTFIASLAEPSDIAMPIPRKDGTIKMGIHEQFATLIDRERSVTHFDELTQASGPMQGAIMRIINDAVVGNKELPLGARRVGSANDENQAAGGNPLADPLNNRFTHIDANDILIGETKSWIDWVWDDCGDKENYASIDAAEEEARVMALWPDALLRAKRDVTAFIRRRPGQLQERLKPNNTNKAWPTRRSVTTAIRIWAASFVHDLDEQTTALLLTGTVGEGWTNEFIPFISNDPLPDPAELLDVGCAWEHVQHRPDRTLAVIDSCAALVMPRNKQKQKLSVPDTKKQKARAKALWELMTRIAKQDGTAADLFEPTCRKLMEHGFWTNGLRKSSEELLAILQPVVTAARREKGKNI